MSRQRTQRRGGASRPRRQRCTGRIAARIERNRGRERSAPGVREHCLQHSPAAMRESDDADTIGPHIRQRTQIVGRRKGVCRLEIRRNLHSVVAHVLYATRAEGTHQHRDVAPRPEASAQLR